MTALPELPNPQRRAIELVKEVAAEKGCRPFLVGGPVRDLLLGRHVIDIDLTLEDGAPVLARALARKVDGRVRSFPQFLTYKVTAEGLPEIDIATARKERYRAPGALPTVTAGKLKDDLLRRDFSINAIAMDLRDGSLHDPTNGERDLAERLIRVLHEKSFIDDPTRMFRAIRLATRLGFTLEAKTFELMAEAIASGAFETVSKERLWRELFLAMDEESAPRVVAELRTSGALDALFGPPHSDVSAQLEDVARLIERDPSLDRYVLYTGIMLRGDTEAISRLEGSGFSQKRARNTLHIVYDVERFVEALASARTERQRFRLYKSATPEMLSLIGAHEPEEARRLARFQEFQTFKLPLRGNDLEVPGGPHVAKALERTREAVFNGEIPVDNARDFARQMAMKYLNELRIEN
jgi:tRNA nucleotidyltransferase (CCA-adding enzyme)